jgi:thymidylate synthase (FAD)
MEVRLIDAMAHDVNVVRAAKVSTLGELSQYVESNTGLINFLMRNNHMSPFEHNVFTFYIKAPIFVTREIIRHRISSPNEESSRYREMDGFVYYIPEGRPLVQVGKTGDYKFEQGEELYDFVIEEQYQAYDAAIKAYRAMLDKGVAKEVARMVLPLGIYSSMYLTINARALMNFLHLRTANNAQWEIQYIANKMELFFEDVMPITYNAWVENERKPA